MKKLYLLALPLTLMATQARGGFFYLASDMVVHEAEPDTSSFKLSQPAGATRLAIAPGQKLTTAMLDTSILMADPPTSADVETFQTNVLDKDFKFNRAVVNPNSFKRTLVGYYKGNLELKEGTPTGYKVDMLAAMVKTHFTAAHLSGAHATMQFHSESGAKKKLKVMGKNTLAYGATYKDKFGDTHKLQISFQMLCAKHASGLGGKVNSEVCDDSEFTPYKLGGAKTDKYKMFLGGMAGNYYHNTIAFVPVSIEAVGNSRHAPAGTYKASVVVVFDVEFLKG